VNPSEYEALTQNISNDARVLYLLGLRPTVDEKTGATDKLNYKNLLTLLNGGSQTADEKRFTLGRQINALIKELKSFNLVKLDDDKSLTKSFNGKRVVLPLFNVKQDDYPALHLTWTTMSIDWCPSDTLYNDLASLIGIIDKQYTQTELGEFIAYWLGRPEMQFSQFQWTQKFVFQIKQRRVASGVKPTQKIGNQWVSPKAAIEADDNAKQLVAKYKPKNNSTDKT